ncbi:PQQ-binding-like beta-propeller repeat protein [Roseomonas sp. NAR14]|uniref:PQQ-binding-like beta-propeller repeat protein n=1 Tax=Roseomonas acroporae TaxID=2937791 RepID=A0A9X1Y7S8_9PROT|nr:PQQ-binding-like beta-propeller repeat protein [Roseomonas acroporae]MCK8784748.1 PQQ-binding-like beta-propeller repeat protein [Roseomonas acroporae]
MPMRWIRAEAPTDAPTDAPAGTAPLGSLAGPRPGAPAAGARPGAGGIARRAALLGGATGLLGGCELFDSVFGSSKTPLPGDRQAVLTGGRGISIDAAAARAPFSLPPPEARQDWPQAGGGPGHAGGHPALGPISGIAWRTDIGTGSAYRRRLTAPPIVAAGTVFAMDTYGVISALDAGNGARRWRVDTRPDEDDDGALGGGLAWDSGVLYAVTGMAEAMAMDPADGRVRWRVPLGAPARGAPTVAGGRLYVPTVDGKLHSLSVTDGQRGWGHESLTVPIAPLGLPAPAVEGDTVVAGFPSGELIGLRVADGRVSWSEALSLRGRESIAEVPGIRAWPVADRGRAYAIGEGGLTIAIDIRSGRRLWERELGGTEPVWVAGDWVFAIGRDAQLAAFARDDGGVRWITQLRAFEDVERKRDPIAWSGPVLAGGRLILTNARGDIAQVNPQDGTLLEGDTRTVPGGALLPGAVAGDTLYLVTENGAVVALR